MTDNNSTESEGVLFQTVKIRGEYDVTFAVDTVIEDAIGRSILEHKQYAVGTTSELMMHLLRPGQTLLDLGAHIGSYSLPAAALGCRVIAVEASSRNVRLLKAAADRNGFEQLTVIEAAISDRPGTLQFTPWGPHGHVTHPVEAAYMPRTQVQAETVDALLERLDCAHVHFVKMDIEGWELRAIHGMERLLRRDDAPLIMFESNAAGLEYYSHTPDQVLRALEGFGYRNYLIDHHQQGRLIPVDADDVQPECVMDYLAAKKIPVDPSPWRVQPFTHDELLTRVVTAASDPHPPYRRHMAISLRDGPKWLVDQPSIRECLTRLRFDSDVSVRLGAAWSATLGPPAAAPSGGSRSLATRLASWLLRKAG